MKWDDYAKSFRSKDRWGQWREWNRLSPVERDYLKSMYSLTPPAPPDGLSARIGSWPASDILGLWLAEAAALIISLILTSYFTKQESQLNLPSALSWWLIFLVPGLLLTWLWARAREMTRK